jgi:uncharacterized protein DUF742
VNGYDGLDDEQGYEEESFGRPFLGKIIRAEAVDGLKGDTEEAAAAASRPYLLTGGRTGGGAAGIGIETMLVRDRAAAPPAARSTAISMIVAACDAPVAVAEVAARIGLPIGVVQVLAGDLVNAGVLLRSESSKSLADDVLFIERLIQGVAAL